MTRAQAGRHIHDLMDSYPDFPAPGILFRDLTPVFAEGEAFACVVDALVADDVEGEARFDAIAGVEARGFLLAAAASYRSGCGVVAVRKAGKLPGEVIAESYALEYGTSTLELHPGRVPVGTRILLLDDLLATGGTLAAAARLLERAGYVVAGIRVVLELEGLGGREALAGYEVASVTTI